MGDLAKIFDPFHIHKTEKNLFSSSVNPFNSEEEDEDKK